jgi:predicted permease
MWRPLRLIWRDLVHRRRLDRELDEELQAAFELVVEEGLRAGLAPEDARRAAVRAMGHVPSVRREVQASRPGAWLDGLLRDARYGLRRLRHDPLFAGFAVLSLAVGIGANTAIFSLWNRILRAPLPAVRDPGSLVILSDPASSGSWTGRWEGASGPRPWLTYGEFQELRDHARSFSSLMASQSSLQDWRVRFDGGDWEVANGRLVSDEFFDVLGVPAAIGRLFSASSDPGGTPTAVLSHDCWQRRFGGRPDVVGRTVTLRSTAFTIVGVAPRGFIGETAGQQPALWVPLRFTPLVQPGPDRLHDTPPEKAMWLHVIGRLRPGVTMAQAEAEANAVFRAGLESFYGAVAADRRAAYLDQRLRLQPAARGASARRPDVAQSLTALLAAVGLLLLITCANLATLLLARGEARRPEVALRLSLGATRGRLLRQVLTEALALSAAGGAAAIGVAAGVHGVLVALLARSDSDFRIAFGWDGLALAFLGGATVLAALLVGGLPAWQITRTDAGAGLKGTRGTVGTGPRRSGRSLAGAQLALALPLLVGAGLLARTVHNLSHADLGFRTDRLLTVRADLRETGYDAARHDAALVAIRDAVRQVPGVEAATFSQLGLFTGGESAVSVEVEGYVPTGEDDRSSCLDVLGPDYFSTLGAVIAAGRDIDDRDRAGAPAACVVNEGFARRFFAGRDPIGRRITPIEDGTTLASCAIVGVARDLRTQGLRDAVEPRFFVAGRQDLASVKAPTLLVRAATDDPNLLASVRRAIERADPAVPILSATTLAERMAPYTAQDRTIAQLAAAFGVVALALAAIGLYGVLAYGVARRTREIAVRIALGALPGGIVALVLRDTLRLVAAGLVGGLALTWAGTRLVGGRLYGVTAGDPLTILAATLLLLLVALGAAFAPARRASRLDPMVALRLE